MLLIAEQAYSETQQPINELRNIAVGTVFGVAGIVMLLTLPLGWFPHSSLLCYCDRTGSYKVKRSPLCCEANQAPARGN